MTGLRTYLGRVRRAIPRDLISPPFAPSGHYYSPLTSADDRSRAISTRRPPVGGIDLRAEQQIRLAEHLDLRPPAEGRWTLGNGMFDAADASMFRAMLLHYRPEKLVEIGSGYSTALALDVAEQELPDLQITCVEPYPARLRSRLRPGDDARLILLPTPLQEVASAVFEELAPNDILFIDSSHVVKAGSDVLWLLLRLLPILRDDVIIHIHDVHWPFEYPDEWFTERRDWNEAYFVHAFLAYNNVFEIALFGDWLAKEHPELIDPQNRGVSGGSLWLRKVGPRQTSGISGA